MSEKEYEEEKHPRLQSLRTETLSSVVKRRRSKLESQRYESVDEIKENYDLRRIYKCA